MSEAVVLNEIALIPRRAGGFWLYIGHPSRLQQVIDESAAARIFPASLVSALEGAHRRYGVWDREMETIFDTPWREALEPPQRILFSAHGSVDDIEELVGVTWAGLREALRAPVISGDAEEMRAIERAARRASVPRLRPFPKRTIESSQPALISAEQAAQAGEAVSHFVRTFQNAESWVRNGHRLAQSMAAAERATDAR